jgi:hypothetical protein
MGWIALATAAIGVVCAVLPNPGMFFAMGLGIVAIVTGFLGYRSRPALGRTRLAGAGGITLGVLALILSFTKYGLTLAALRRIESLL